MPPSVVAIIPARGGSKGIPRKNVRELGGKPLIGHAIETCKQSEVIGDCVVSTEDAEIARVATKFGTDRIIERPTDLAEDHVPLAPVVEHAYGELTDRPDYVVCIQPTVPLLSVRSLDEGVDKAINARRDSLVFIRDSTHLYWRGSGEKKTPVSGARTNRQGLEPIYEEIGVFVSRRDVVERGRRVGDDPSFYVVNRVEGIDIDRYADWILAEYQLDRQSVLYRVTGNARTGLGHVYRGITVADEVFQHDLEFIVLREDDLAVEILEESRYPYSVESDQDGVVQRVRDEGPEIVVNDVLDTDAEYITALQDAGARVVNFEDLGEGAASADAVINALYEYSDPPANHYFGYRYFCLRPEFKYARKTGPISSVDRVMASFGGIDENDLTARTVRALADLERPVTMDVVLGPGYERTGKLDELISELRIQEDVSVTQDVSWMSDHMEEADLLITSNGRTIFEAASMNLPMISIAQNEREQRHPFAHLSNGIMVLGLAAYVSEEDILHAVKEYIADANLRERMRTALGDQDIDNGVRRVLKKLFSEEGRCQ